MLVEIVYKKRAVAMNSVRLEVWISDDIKAPATVCVQYVRTYIIHIQFLLDSVYTKFIRTHVFVSVSSVSVLPFGIHYKRQPILRPPTNSIWGP